jgi:hypothetical protein
MDATTSTNTLPTPSNQAGFQVFTRSTDGTALFLTGSRSDAKALSANRDDAKTWKTRRGAENAAAKRPEAVAYHVIATDEPMAWAEPAKKPAAKKPAAKAAKAAKAPKAEPQPEPQPEAEAKPAVAAADLPRTTAREQALMRAIHIDTDYETGNYGFACIHSAGDASVFGSLTKKGLAVSEEVRTNSTKVVNGKHVGGDVATWLNLTSLGVQVLERDMAAPAQPATKRTRKSSSKRKAAKAPVTVEFVEHHEGDLVVGDDDERQAAAELAGADSEKPSRKLTRSQAKAVKAVADSAKKPAKRSKVKRASGLGESLTADDFRALLARTAKSAQKRIEKFQLELAADAYHAFRWRDAALCAAAERELCRQLLAAGETYVLADFAQWLDNVVQSYATSTSRDETNMAFANYAAVLLRELRLYDLSR